LRERLAPHHADVDAAFYSWNVPWLHPDFERWDITDVLDYIRVPVLVVQGENDQYGTLRQVEIVAERCYCPVETAILPGIRHVPQREAPDLTLSTIAGFITRLLRDHREGEPIPGIAAT
jgi:pimeloyl-ACP methyl ester carboxylesterase